MDSTLAERQLMELEDLLQRPRREQVKDCEEKNIKARIWSRAISLCEILGWTNRVRGPLKQVNEHTPRQRPTAYLDGLRGFAAMLVYSLHHQNWARADLTERGILENAYGWERHYHFATLPGIRVFFSGGHTAVSVFFIISGYVLSMKPLSLIQAGEPTGLARNMSSAFFRRWVRLYIPVFITTFLWMLSWHVFKIRSNHPLALTPEKTLKAELWRFYADFKNYSFVFHSEFKNSYNDHTWSIPMEFKGSIVVWTSLIALAECTTNTRLAIEAALAWYFLYVVDGWYCSLFMTGVLLCDLDLLASLQQLPPALPRHSRLPNWLCYAFLVVALYLAGVPSITDDVKHLKTEPGWYYLAYLKPQAMWDFRWFYRFWAATLMMICVPRISWLKKSFEHPFCQYLGRISFSLYLVHGPILWSIGDRVYAAVGRIQESHPASVPHWINLFPFPSWGPFCLEINYLAAQMILLPLTLGVAELVTLLVDEPSVKFAQWLYSRGTKTRGDLLPRQPVNERKD